MWIKFPVNFFKNLYGTLKIYSIKWKKVIIVDDVVSTASTLNEIAKLEPLPFEIAFSYARAIQGPALQIWQGKEENIEQARKVFLESLRDVRQADLGKL